MRILAITNMFPTMKDPTSGTFVEQQIKGLRQIGIHVDVMYINRVEKGMLVYLGLGPKVRRRVKDWQPDIVHAMYGGIMADVATHAVKNRPTIISFCGDDLLGELLSGKLRRLISRYGVMASHRAAVRTSGIIVKSKNLQEALPNYVARSKVRIIPNGVDLDRFKPLDKGCCQSSLGWKTDCFHVLFPFNSRDPRKRPALAESAIDHVRSLGVQTEFHRLQGVPHGDVPIWLNASDVVLLTSLHEGSPNIIKEALACNVPIVSVDVGDVRERINGVPGCYLANPRPDHLGDSLYLIYKGPRRTEGRAKMRDLSLVRIALQMKDFYEEVLFSWQQDNAFQIPTLHGETRQGREI